jgi:hypothetical protein
VKIRRRLYDHTGDCFFEVKRKTRNDRTEKRRIAIDGLGGDLTDRELAIIDYPRLQGHIPQFKLDNRFTRITLCDLDFKERITIDQNIMLSAKGASKLIEGVALIEIKQARLNLESNAIRPLRAMGLRSGPFSKYSLGVAYLYSSVKHNTFRPLMLKLDKYVPE